MLYAYKSLQTSSDELSLGSEEAYSKNTICNQPKRLKMSWTICLAIAFAIAILTGGTLRLLSSVLRINSDGLNCGNSSSEALAAGCEFDVMSFTWSRQECFDRELMDDFLALKNWTWWTDGVDGVSLQLSDVEQGQYSQLYVKWEYHLYHCTYMWKKMHRAILAGRPIDSYIMNINHTNHCEMMLLDDTVPPENKTTIIAVKYPTCPGF